MIKRPHRQGGGDSAQGIGASLTRKEDERFMHGRGEYVPNICMVGMVDIAFVRSPIAHGHIIGIEKPEGFEHAIYTLGDMEGVKPVTQLGDRHLHWKAEIAGKEKEWDVEITEQMPDQRIAWTSRGGVVNDGIVMLQPLTDKRTKISLHMAYLPEGVVESVDDELDDLSLRAKGDLERFKAFIEEHSSETGA